MYTDQRDVIVKQTQLDDMVRREVARRATQRLDTARSGHFLRRAANWLGSRLHGRQRRPAHTDTPCVDVGAPCAELAEA
ncbi:MAG: hypothetical protein JXB47_10775 [Anaerolineae bacterium]|nr:hypothetical protein [Anaerolineae bacterium]